MIVLVDADTLCYASAAMAEDEGEQIARWNANKAIESLIQKLGHPEYTLYITGSSNFRNAIYPEYKANRLKVPRPKYLGAVKDHLLAEWKAVESDGCEADDLVAIEQIKLNEAGTESVICSIDKDLDMIPGWHYSPEITRKGVIVKEARRYIVSPLEGLRFFYTQLLTGDPTDNIKGVQGVGRIGAGKILDGLSSETELFNAVRDTYGCEEEMEMNARVLWIQRKPNENIVERWKELGFYETGISES